MSLVYADSDSLAALQMGWRAELAASARPVVTARQGTGWTSCWTLNPDQVVTLKPQQAGVLLVTRGRLWVTFNNAAQDLSARGGDHFLACGESLRLVRGDVVVMEAYDPSCAVASCFSWTPAR